MTISLGRTGWCRQFAIVVALLTGFTSCRGTAQEPAAASPPPQKDSSVIAADGTASITRVVPVPATISPEARHLLTDPAVEKALPSGLTA